MVHTLDSDIVTFHCDKHGVKVENSKLHADFTLGSNGILYTIDSVLVPNKCKLQTILYYVSSA